MTAGTPPAYQKYSTGYRPVVFTLASTGTRRWIRSKSSMLTSTPASRATTGRCSRAFVDPPMAACRMIAFSNASLVRICRAVRFSSIRVTSCLPVARA
jgi:hypothetical protein